MNNISIKPLSKDLINDFLDFFDNEAFCDNPEWAGCYCLYYHFGNDQEWQSRTIADNRKTAGEMIIQGKIKGYLAYMDGKVVGWCNVNDISSFERLSRYSEIWQDTHGKCCSIVCFIISPEHRRKGIASRLLEHACSDYAKLGYEYIEAYPWKGAKTNAEAYHGPLSMYEKAGFTIYKEVEKCYIVRRNF